MMHAAVMRIHTLHSLLCSPGSPAAMQLGLVFENVGLWNLHRV